LEVGSPPTFLPSLAAVHSSEDRSSRRRQTSGASFSITQPSRRESEAFFPNNNGVLFNASVLGDASGFPFRGGVLSFSQDLAKRFFLCLLSTLVVEKASKSGHGIPLPTP